MLHQEVIQLYDWFRNALLGMGMSEGLFIYARAVTLCLSVFIIATVAYLFTSKYLVGLLERMVAKSETKYDDIFFNYNFLKHAANIVPVLIIKGSLNWIFKDFSGFNAFMHNLVSICIVIVILLIIQAFMRGLTDLYESLDNARSKPVRSYMQTVMLIVTVIGVLIIVSILFDIKLSKVFTGIGATAAVIMLVFKDTLLGFVASIQLSVNNMVKPGDWISMSSQGADGTVLEITLNTVKVQNWDKTITTIPTYALVSHSFSNWKGMQDSGGRRIKRSVSIDMKSIKFCNAHMIEKYKKISILKDFIDGKLKEAEKSSGLDDVFVNSRMTNVGVFRAYIESYLKQHPKIHNNMTFLVRHLKATEKGLPIEIYVFSKDQEWADYEELQADIIDHILAIIPEFELRVFQYPTSITPDI